MSHSSNLFSNRKVEIKNKSGFDLSHSNFLTQKVGTLVPICTIPMLPNDSVSLGFMSQIKLPPMATSFYGRVDYRLEAFFVPWRILWGGYENFMTQPIADPYGTSVVRPHFLPNFQGRYLTSSGSDISNYNSFFGRGSLADYLGIKGRFSASSSTIRVAINNILPFLAYHKIYDDWYRNANIQKPVFVRPASGASASLAHIPWLNDTCTAYSAAYGSSIPTSGGSDGGDLSDVVGYEDYNSLSSFGFQNVSLLGKNIFSYLGFNDGSNLFTLRQRNWSKDYFTTATLYPQNNSSIGGASVSMESTDGADVSFTISQLRQANILQKWMERNNIAGQRYADQIRATFGVMPSDALLDRPVFLGGSNFGIYTNSIATTANGSSNESNPYSGQTGSDAGQTSGFGKDSLIDKFTATEYGFVMVLGSIVPHATYSTGSNRMFGWSSFGDIPNPMFEGLGEEAVLKGELFNSSSPNSVFGYVQQYAYMKYMNDEVHGLLVDGQSLDSFSLQRSFDDSVALNSDFIQIPTTFLDQVLAVATDDSGFSAWENFYFDVKKTSLLSQYTIPTLGETKNTHFESVPNTGRYL